MHVSVIEYRITGIDAAGWAATCDEIAPAFALLPGLVGKIWLEGSDGRYGGVYVWEDEAAYRAFLDSDLGAGFASHPNLEAVTMRDWAVDEKHTAITGGILQVV
ncbi:YdhR family protein [Actinomycetospora lutea]|uniref:YdhR family protein n=1 Tax=Actinomycetospora lutea TaxID=663604 RepID=UPI0023658474|nr:YdhR family protein [Actinomycetospora lutea]MDD7937942.1 YdhR family protein [Actinomycetospora lutea]